MEQSKTAELHNGIRLLVGGSDAVSRDRRWAIGNERCEMEIALDAGGAPVLIVLRRVGAVADWTPPAGLAAIGPVVEVAGKRYQPGSPEMTFTGAMVEADSPTPAQAGAGPALQLAYRCENGLEVQHYLSPAPSHAAWRTWTRLLNPTGRPLDGITRFDALNLSFGVSQAEPQAAYLLGWLDTPRADAPGRPPIPFKFAGWIPNVPFKEKNEVKQLRDGVMAAFKSAVRAVECAVAIQRATAEQEAMRRLRVRIGIHAGDAIEEAGDLHGLTVITASRITQAAQGGEIVVSGVVAQLTAPPLNLEPGLNGGFVRFTPTQRCVHVRWNAPRTLHLGHLSPPTRPPAPTP